MAGDWIKMRMDLPEDPAVYKIASAMKTDRLSVIGRLYAFWAWADKFAVDGRVDGATSTVVDDVTRCDGFASAMQSVKWLEIGDDHIAIPNHDRHNGESAKERGLKNQRQARWRAGKDADASTHVDGGASTSPSTDASTRIEKRREEKKTQAEPSGFSEFWHEYPNRTAKANAVKAWGKIPAELHPEIMEALGVQKRSTAWTKDDGQFVPHAATWLNGKRWEDQPATVRHQADAFAGAL
jgi:hypothetical protein